MSEAMARQFGTFLGNFIDYDTRISLVVAKHFMCINVSLDVLLPLKRKKIFLLGSNRIAYAQFKYEKISLFCFLCGKLGHGESFCPLRVRIDLEKFSSVGTAPYRCRKKVYQPDF